MLCVQITHLLHWFFSMQWHAGQTRPALNWFGRIIGRTIDNERDFSHWP